MTYSLPQLLSQLENGAQASYLFFWGHEPFDPPKATCLSQWYAAPFSVDGQLYRTAEHWMMAEKARLFKDRTTLEKILRCEESGEAKKLGREVQGFDGKVWDEQKYAIVLQGNIHKFEQNPDLKAFLLSTGNQILVEASPVDGIWGIGMARDHSQAKNPASWKGENLLGFALMEARDDIRERAKS